MFFGRAGSGAITLVWPCRQRYAALPPDQADSIRRPHSPQTSSPASRYRRTTGSACGDGPAQTGLRLSELTGLDCGDVTLGTSGRPVRACPGRATT